MTEAEFQYRSDRLAGELTDAIARWESRENAKVEGVRFYRDAYGLPTIVVDAYSRYKIDGVVGTRVPVEGL
jgi:hypothetical protein